MYVKEGEDTQQCSLKTKNRQFYNFVITSGTKSCCDDNPQIVIVSVVMGFQNLVL